MTARDRSSVEIFGERYVDEEDAARFGDEGGRRLDRPRLTRTVPKPSDAERPDDDASPSKIPATSNS